MPGKSLRTPALTAAPPTRVVVDAGGTWLRVKTQSASGRWNGPVRIPVPPRDQFAQSLRRLLKTRGWLASAELTVGAKGIWTAKEKSALARTLRGSASRVRVLSDVELAFEESFGRDGVGVLLVSGTGSIAYGRNKRGVTARAGGLGPVLGDEGSGFWIGKMYLRSLLDRGQKRAWVLSLVRSADYVRRVAALAPAVIRCAGTDPVCRRIVDDAAKHLAALVFDVRKKLKLPASTPIALWGSVARSSLIARRLLRLID